MFKIEDLAAYIEPKIWNAYPNPWLAKLYSAKGPIHLKFKLKKLNKNCYSYRLYDVQDNCLIQGVSIYGLAAYLAPFVLQAAKEKEILKALLLWFTLEDKGKGSGHYENSLPISSPGYAKNTRRNQ